MRAPVNLSRLRFEPDSGRLVYQPKPGHGLDEDLSDLEPGTYFWRVSALDAMGYESAWSNTAHFIYPMTLR